MKLTYFISRTESYSHLSQFESVRDFNNNIEQFLADHKTDFTQSELIAFKRLVRLSCKVPGIATASKRYILQAINDMANGFGISESTFHRMKRKAIKLGALSVETTRRQNGSQSANVWHFNRWDNCIEQETIDTPRKDSKSKAEARPVNDHEINTDEEQLTPRQNWYSIKTNKQQYIRTETSKPLDYSFIYDNQLNQFIETIKPFYSDYASVLEFVRSVHQNTSKYQDKVANHDVQALAIEAFKRTIAVEKEKRHTRHPINNVIGLFVKIFREIINREYTAAMFRDFEAVMANC